ncbi:MAG TPA: ribosome biogenesis GTP-binding protein YihA/YsxC [Prolixibacteraceae bacterium]|jgi:GTP-binding protein|nr:ribosome biogenesis GTP-binding protein YihA/YsxC [Prolixibacteraceae bacterium]
MLIKSAEFVISNTDPGLCPVSEQPEFAFIGRSNVGKSSLINMLMGMKYLAKTSAEPGKTRLINHFIVNNQWFLVDLPGYGYAKVLRSSREKWIRFIRKYILERENLYCVMVLLDIRLEPQKNDLDFMSWLGENEIPFVMVFTKADKLGKNVVEQKLDTYREEMLKSWEELPRIFVTSAEKGTGKDEVLNFIEDTMRIQ